MHSAIVIADAVSPVLESIGRLHPIMVHLPLGLVFAAVVVEAARLIQRRPSLSAFTPIALGLAALGAVVASGTGWFFSESEAETSSLFWHRWLGITCAIVLIAVAWMAIRAARHTANAAQITPIARGVLLAAALLVGWVGHLGGDMVWGENYVLEPILKAWNGGSPSADGSNGDDATGSGATAANTTSKGDSDADKMAFYTSILHAIINCDPTIEPKYPILG
jgi:uncharacterized membrane protein